MRYINALREALEQLIIQKNLYIMGEDIQEPYGGAFKVTKGLSASYPEHVMGVPMSEQGVTAVGVGMALMGEYVAVEIMFGDFITLCCDQLVNHAAKFHGLYGAPLHLIVRTPSGGYRGYGATHSQSLEKMYLGIPGMQVAAPNILCHPGEIMGQALDSGIPTLFVENKLDYPRELWEDNELLERKLIFQDDFPIARVSFRNEIPEWTILTYGGMAGFAVEAAKQLMYDSETTVDVVAVTNLSRGSQGLDTVIRTDKILVAEEGCEAWGWGRSLAYELNREGRRVITTGALNKVIPAAGRAEESVLVTVDGLVSRINEEEMNHG